MNEAAAVAARSAVDEAPVEVDEAVGEAGLGCREHTQGQHPCADHCADPKADNAFVQAEGVQEDDTAPVKLREEDRVAY